MATRFFATRLSSAVTNVEMNQLRTSPTRILRNLHAVREGASWWAKIILLLISTIKFLLGGCCAVIGFER